MSSAPVFRPMTLKQAEAHGLVRECTIEELTGGTMPTNETPGTSKPQHRKPTDEELGNRFLHHPPHGDQQDRYQLIRQKMLEAALLVRDLTPCCPEQTRAINALDEAMFLANAAIARHG